MTTCQICGREIKAKSGVIAHHGYQRQYGAQTASCPGARHLPYEQSCDQIPVVIERTAAFIESAKGRIQNLLDHPPASLNNGLPGRGTDFSKPDDFDPQFPKRGYTRYGELFIRAIKENERDIRLAGLEIEFLKERLKNWVKVE